MNLIWPPNKTFEYKAVDPTLENGLVIEATTGEGKNKLKKKRAEGKNR